MELTTCVSFVSVIQRVFNAGPIPPTATGLLPDLTLERDVAMTPVALSTDFTGPSLTFALAPGSAALPDGLLLSTAGVLSGTPTADTAPVLITVRATNSVGSADSSFEISVQEMLLEFTASLTGATPNPTYGPSAQTGVPLTAVASAFSAGTPTSFAYQWKTVESGDIAGATGESYTPSAALFDGEQVFCTITPAGYPPKNTEALVIRYAPPVTSGSPGEQFWDIDTGAQTIDMSPFASGTALAWSVMAQGASINPATGLLSIRTDSQAIGAVAMVGIENSGGRVEIAFPFTVEDPAADPGPDLGIPILDDVTDTIGLTVDAPCTVYWRRDPTGTNADPGDVIAGGGHDSGSFPVSPGLNSVEATFAFGNDGLQEIAFVAAVTPDEPSLVRKVAIDIDTSAAAAPTLTASVPVNGATDVQRDVTPVLTFSEAIFAGTGTVSLYDIGASATVETFDLATDIGTGPGTLEISGSDLTIRPSATLAASATLGVLIDAGALQNAAGNDFAGITNPASVAFTTEAVTAAIDTDFGASFPTAYASVWASMQDNGYNVTTTHLPSETWDAYPATVTDGGVLGDKSGAYPQLRFAVPVEVGKTYTIDADFPLGENDWDGPLRVKIGSAIDQNDYAQIDESEAGQPRVVELRGQQVTATTTELWFAVILEFGSAGSAGGDPAISMLKVEEV